MDQGPDRSTPLAVTERYELLYKVPDAKAWFCVATQRPLVPCRGRGKRAVSGGATLLVSQAKFPTRQGLAVVLVDTHGSVSYDNSKPDVVGYLANKPQSVCHIALVGNVKARREANEDGFDASEKGQLESFLEDLLLGFQPHPVLRAGGGDKWLLGLLQDPNAHGLPADIVIGQEPVVMDQFLGVGRISVVYSGAHQGVKVAVKRANWMRQHNLEQEAAILLKIQGVVPLVPRLVAHDDQYDVLLLEPVGVQFAPRATHFTQQTTKADKQEVATADDFCQLVDVLETVHNQYNLVHRDVRLPNLFRSEETGAADLLEGGHRKTVEDAPHHHLQVIAEPWHVAPIWSDMLAAAQREDYAGLKMHIRNILP